MVSFYSILFLVSWWKNVELVREFCLKEGRGKEKERTWLITLRKNLNYAQCNVSIMEKKKEKKQGNALNVFIKAIKKIIK